MSTIFALATARGKAGVSVVRISGPLACGAAENLVGQLPESRKAGLRVIKTSGGLEIDEALVLPFEAGGSFTGEKVVELHLHGSTAVVSAVLRELSSMKGLRLAEPGEFTRRALENGKLDLAQVEGLADLIDAETEAQRKQALRVMRGALSEQADIWRSKLLRALALLEVTIDFADEDVPVDVTPEVRDLIEDVRKGMLEQASGSVMAERIRDGFEVAIIGKPNAGKSTLLNKLAGRDAAITSELAGTTRDVIEVRMDLGGLPVTLLDTAGLRESGDEIESLGVALAMRRAKEADLRLFLLDKEDESETLGVGVERGDIVIYGKADLGPNGTAGVSGKTGQGVDALLEDLAKELGQRASSAGSAIRERHRVALLDGAEALLRSIGHVENGPDWSELAAEEMRQSVRAVDSIIGRVDVENVLDVIFSSFCLGK